MDWDFQRGVNPSSFRFRLLGSPVRRFASRSPVIITTGYRKGGTETREIRFGKREPGGLFTADVFFQSDEACLDQNSCHRVTLVCGLRGIGWLTS
jgi:hypothetical protein